MFCSPWFKRRRPPERPVPQLGTQAPEGGGICPQRPEGTREQTLRPSAPGEAAGLLAGGWGPPSSSSPLGRREPPTAPAAQ